MANLKEQCKTCKPRPLFWVVIAVFVGFLIFHAGVVVGVRRSHHEVRGWQVRAPGMGPVALPHGFVEHGHGAVGRVASSSPEALTLLMRDGSRETIRLATTTDIRDASGATTTGALAEGARVVVLGRPDAGGVITAEAVRVLAP